MSDVKVNTIKRIASAVVALPVYAYAIITDTFYNIPILLVSMFISIACLYEFYQMSDRKEEGSAFFVEGIAAGVIINIFMYTFAYGGRYGFLAFIDYLDPKGIMFFFILIILIALFLQVYRRPIQGATYSLGATIFGVIFIVGFFSHIILMKALENGWYYIIILNCVIMCNDTGAYFGGVFFGKHKVGFPVSPNKTWEGYFSGVIFSILGMVGSTAFFAHFYNAQLFTYPEAVLVGIALSIIGNTGDLIESVMKRDNNVKDSGTIIPGHGGMWDVFDAIMFSLPVFYYYLIIKGVA
jgi:phosphatidate cytidylyltransferase